MCNFAAAAVFAAEGISRAGHAEYLASIDRIARFAAARQVRWLLGAHIEMAPVPGKSFEPDERVRQAEHVLELPPAIVPEIRQALSKMGGRPRVEVHDEFVLFPYPAEARGKTPPDCAREFIGSL